MKKTVLITLIALISWGAYAQHDHGSHAHHGSKEMDHSKMDHKQVMFKDKSLTEAYGHYIDLKEALVASDAAEVKMAAGMLQKSLNAVSNGENAKMDAARIESSKNLDQQRKVFASLSTRMGELVKKAEISMGEIYLAYCPMANGNKGGSWLSNEKGIRNPYFGDKMLKCGSVKETIN